MKNITKVAELCGFELREGPFGDTFVCTADDIALLVGIVRKDERERCAKVCEDMHDEDRPSDYAWSIRALKDVPV
jgi:hypothetical protein